jgi:HSP20 family protein
MTIAKWRPFDDIMGAHDEIGKFLEDFFDGKNRKPEEKFNWQPRVDIAETQNSIVVKADIPGMTREDIKITLSDNILTISGDKKIERDETTENYHRLERVFGKFARRFYIPTGIDSEKIAASYKDGVLFVKLPKVMEERTKEIPISVE